MKKLEFANATKMMLKSFSSLAALVVVLLLTSVSDLSAQKAQPDFVSTPEARTILKTEYVSLQGQLANETAYTPAEMQAIVTKMEFYNNLHGKIKYGAEIGQSIDDAFAEVYGTSFAVDMVSGTPEPPKPSEYQDVVDLLTQD